MPKQSSRLQAEIQQSTPFPDAATEALLGLSRTADMLGRRFDATVAPQGITRGQYNVLRILRGSSPAGLPTLAVAQRLIEQAPGITRMLDRLEAKGLIRRERCQQDRRRVLCWITEKGQAVLDALEAPVRSAEVNFLAMLSRDEQQTLIGLLDRIRGGQPA